MDQTWTIDMDLDRWFKTRFLLNNPPVNALAQATPGHVAVGVLKILLGHTQHSLPNGHTDTCFLHVGPNDVGCKNPWPYPH